VDIIPLLSDNTPIAKQNEAIPMIILITIPTIPGKEMVTGVKNGKILIPKT